MKNISKVMLLLVLLCCLSSCNVKYHENSFFSNGILDEELLPKLPEPDAQSMLFVEGNGITENTVYVSSNEETEEDYFQKVLEYTSSLEFEHYGTIHNIKQSFPILGVDPTYYYHSTSILSSLLPSNYYFEEENSYILAYSNGDLKFDADGTNQYIDDAHMIRVCKTPGEYNNDEFTFDYDYYIEFANEPMLWLDDDKQVKTLNTFVMYDYGMHIEGQVTTLLDGNLIWFNLKDYGIDKLFAGDELVIEYTGEYIYEECYPGNVAADLMNIRSIEVIEADIVEFTVSAIPGNDELDLVPVDSKYSNYILSNDGYVISENGTFKKYDEYPERTILYASLPKSANSIRIDGLYDYNPNLSSDNNDENGFYYGESCTPVVKDYKEPTCQEEGYEIIGCTACDAIYETIVLPIIECQYEDNKCKWCGKEI